MPTLDWIGKDKFINHHLDETELHEDDFSDISVEELKKQFEISGNKPSVSVEDIIQQATSQSQQYDSELEKHTVV